MEHPDLLLKLHEYKHRDRLRDVETWRLARSAGQPRANCIGQLLRHLIAAARQRWSVQVRSKPVKPDLANLRR